ncbi:unnamed protein product [Microthlaspi erraticum]|uniref:Reverse transcriptase domain-containing protein n=1 Tax=Microthlaspi erraticum TaxID=1685480 RepID=A0A6D2ISW0_9BRAS|nr:unnamed protein product [Microthlaspi erraticum]
MLKKYATDVLAIFETHAGGDRASKICRGLGFENSYKVDATGQSGGLWLLWRTSIGDVVVVEASDQFIHARIANGDEIVHVIAVYASPTVSRRSGLWDELRRVIGGLDGPVLVGGDFNTIVRVDERSGGNGCLSPDSLAFGEWINDFSLIDMGFRGNQFTSRRGKVVRHFVAKRLDRVFYCAHARLKWQEAVVTHLPFLSSDHAPLYIQLSPEIAGDPRRRPFRFEAAWLKHDGFQDLMKASWKGDLNTNVALRPSDTLLVREEDLIKALDVVLEQEEMIWFQKSREKWIPLGDRNTRFFHTSTVIRRQRNRIEMLKRSDGSWITDSAEMELLAREFSAFEIEAAVRGMGKYKTPGPDGYQPVFYQSCWDTVGTSVVRFVLDFFATGVLPPETNDVLLVLIPKVNKPVSITQFRPISLCNVLFKTITKVMVERLKLVISKLIGPAQASFIFGRLSTDNIVLVQEAVHSMRRKEGRKGWMLLKLDLEKAYDRIRWDFLEDTLTAVGLPEAWICWILRCVTGPAMNLLWNGEKTEAFTPSRGLRQGDPISPYLFVLCMERLCHLIEHSVEFWGMETDYPLTWGSKVVTHLFCR